MQSVISQIPTPTSEMLAFGILMFVGGMTVPTRYGIERLEGFGRFMASKGPYKAPPGMDEQNAMKEAVEGDTEGENDE